VCTVCCGWGQNGKGDRCISFTSEKGSSRRARYCKKCGREAVPAIVTVCII
jgi:hypothetical protein